MNDDSTITIHMVSSLDGYIASFDGDVSWMLTTDQYEKGITLSEKDIKHFLQSIDCYVMGSGTYETALKLGWPYGDKPVIVLSSRLSKSSYETVSFYSGDITTLVEQKLQPHYQNIWMVGGAKLTRDFINQSIADKLVVTIGPVILGEGIRFFEGIEKQVSLSLEYEKAFSDGMVELTYTILKS
ncbi:MAG: dihydrofolate reductase family protein [Bacteroidota bacterium]